MPAVRIDDLSKVYQNGTQALDGVGFEVPEGAFYGLLGPNGAGKTTLISILGGLCLPTGGSAQVCGFDVVRQSREARHVLGIVPQELVYDPFFTARRYLIQQSAYHGIFDNEDWINELLENLGLSEVAHLNSRRLSGGMKRRLMVATALVHKPRVVILDEPTAGVDVSQRRGLWRFIRRLNSDGTTVILTTHYLEEAEELCERIVMIDHGRLLANERTADLLRDSRFHAKAVKVQLADGAGLPADLGFACAPEADEEGFFSIMLDEYEQIEEVIASLKAGGARIEAMEITNPDLEDVFVGLTGEDRR